MPCKGSATPVPFKFSGPFFSFCEDHHSANSDEKLFFNLFLQSQLSSPTERRWKPHTLFTPNTFLPLPMSKSLASGTKKLRICSSYRSRITLLASPSEGDGIKFSPSCSSTSTMWILCGATLATIHFLFCPSAARSWAPYPPLSLIFPFSRIGKPRRFRGGDAVVCFGQRRAPSFRVDVWSAVVFFSVVAVVVVVSRPNALHSFSRFGRFCHWLLHWNSTQETVVLGCPKK